MMRCVAPRLGTRQTGTALFVGLVVLLILAILAVAVMRMVSMQERMARNLRDQNIAFQAAEAALRVAEALIDSRNAAELDAPAPPWDPFDKTAFDSDCDDLDGHGVPVVYCNDAVGKPEPTTALTGDDRVMTDLLGDALQPKYVIQLLRSEGGDGGDTADGCPKVVVFRISAIGFGPEGSGARSYLQSVYRHQPGECGSSAI